MAENGVLQELTDLVVSEGLKEGTPEYDRRLRQVKVEKCREMRGHFTCSECEVYDFCDIAKQVLRDHRGIE